MVKLNVMPKVFQYTANENIQSMVSRIVLQINVAADSFIVYHTIDVTVAATTVSGKGPINV